MTTTKRPLNPRGAGDQLRAQLIDAAKRLLLAPQQVAAPSLRAVARECNVSPTAIYLHFASQKDLLVAVLQAQELELLEYLLAHDDPELGTTDRFCAISIAYVEWGLANPGAYQLLFESADALEISHADNESDGLILPQIVNLVRQTTALNQKDANLWTMRLIAALHGQISLRIHKPQHDWVDSPREGAQATVELFLNRMVVELPNQ